jgi:hypothetical protein
MRRGLQLTMFATVAVAAFVGAPAAQASVTIGQAHDSGFTCGGAEYPLVQAAAPSAPSYTVPSGGGVLTSWSHQANADTTTTLRLKVYLPTADPSKFTAVGESSISPVLHPSILNTFPTRIPVQAGDVLGMSVITGSAPACLFSSVSGDLIRLGSGDPAVGTDSTFAFTGPSERINVSAVLEADADHDGFGDETQDRCPRQATTHGQCRPPKITHVRVSGGKVKYRLNERAAMKFTIQKRNGGGFTTLGHFKASGKTGNNSNKIPKRIRRKLGSSHGRVVVRARDAGGLTSSKKKKF